MKLIENIFNKIRPNFEKGGKFEKWFYAYDANETLLFVPDHVTKKGSHIRDYFDQKRLMITVVVALIPCLLFGMFNAGYQHFGAIGDAVSQASILSCMLIGARYVVPILLTTYAVGLGLEMFFASVRKHEVSEGFVVSGILIALIVPPTIPLWQVAVATVFGVVIGLEVFGGTGMNVLNPALVTRAFLFFSYPAQISGGTTGVWTIVGQGDRVVDGYSGATALAVAASAKDFSEGPVLTTLTNFGTTWIPGGMSFDNLFWGLKPGSIGEGCIPAILIGAFILIITGVGSWRTMTGVVLGGLVMGYVFNYYAPAFPEYHFFHIPAYYHLIMGGFLFGAVFMATDPVSSSATNTGKWIYGFLIGVMCMLIRVINPAYPEGMMLAILFLNVFAPLIDHFVVEQNIKRRLKRAQR